MSQRCAYMSERCLERAPKKYAITVPRTLLIKTPSDLSIQYNKFRRYAPTRHRSTFRHATALHLPPHHRRSTSLHTMPRIPPNPPPLPHRHFQPHMMPPLHSHITATSYCPTTAAPPQNSLSLTPPAAFTSSPRHPQPATTVTPAATHSQHLRCRYHQRL